jgi:uncharacterized protein
MILDFHAHVDHAEVYGWIDPPEKILGLMDEAGIEKASIQTYLDHPVQGADPIATIADAVRRYPDRFVGCVRLDPNFRAEARAGLLRSLDLGFRSVKVHPTTSLAHPASEATVSLLEQCAGLGVPVLFHCGDDPYTTPQAIEAGAAMVPGCTVVLSHMGGYFHAEDALAAAVRRPNIVLETSAMPYPERIADAVRAIGPGRVVFGSDGPGCNPALELAKVRMAGLDPEAERLVLGATGARLLGLAEDAR